MVGPTLEHILETRLTDDHTYKQVKDNARGLIEKGIKPDTSDLIYIKLAMLERNEWLFIQEGIDIWSNKTIGGSNNE